MSRNFDQTVAGNPSYCLRAGRSSYIILSVFCIPLITLLALALPKTITVIAPIAIFIALYTLAVTWLRVLEVKLHRDTISIKRLFRRTVFLYVPELIYCDLEIGHDDVSLSRDEPPFRLVFKTRNALGDRRYMVNA